MKKHVILFFLLLICLYSKSQDSIVYIVPDSVEILLNKYVSEKKSYDPDIRIYFYLTSTKNGGYRLSASDGNDGFLLIEKTNRFILINTNKYPLLLNYDIRFASYKKDAVGSFGNRFNGLIPNNHVIYEGYSISFDAFGEYIKEDWGISRKKND